MATIHKLSSKLTLNTKDFVTGMDRARDQAKKFGSGMKRLGVNTAKMGAAAGAAAAGGIALLYRQHAAGIDQAAKFAQSIDISTEKLLGLRHAGELAGVGQQQLDKSLQQMVRRIGEAEQGTGSTADALRTLGLDAQRLAQMSPDEQFAAIAESISGMDNSTQKATTAYQLFGREGMNLIPLLNSGAAGLADMQAEAERLGITFSAVDAAKVEAANDAITRVKAGITGAGQTLTIALTPYVEATAEKLISMSGSGEQAGSRITRSVEWVAQAVAKAADVFGFFKAAFHGAQAAVTGGMALLIKGWQYQGKAIESVVNLLPGVEVRFSDTLGMIGDEMIRTAKDAAEKSQRAFDDAMAGKNSQAVGAFFDDINAQAQANAEQMAAAGEAAADGITAGFDPEKLATIHDKLAQLETQAMKLGQADASPQLADLQELGATNEQLEQAARWLEQIEHHEARVMVDAELGTLDQELDRIGMSDIDIKLADLRELGATNDQLEHARRKIEQIGKLAAAQERQAEQLDLAKSLTDAATGPTERLAGEIDDIAALYSGGLIDYTTFDHALMEVEDRYRQSQDSMKPQPLRLVESSSAEAERLAYMASRSVDQPREDRLRLDIDASPLDAMEQRLAAMPQPLITPTVNTTGIDAAEDRLVQLPEPLVRLHLNTSPLDAAERRLAALTGPSITADIRATFGPMDVPTPDPVRIDPIFGPINTPTMDPVRIDSIFGPATPPRMQADPLRVETVFDPAEPPRPQPEPMRIDTTFGPVDPPRITPDSMRIDTVFGPATPPSLTPDMRQADMNGIFGPVEAPTFTPRIDTIAIDPLLERFERGQVWNIKPQVDPAEVTLTPPQPRDPARQLTRQPREIERLDRQTARGLQRDDTPKRQLDVQQRTLAILQDIHRTQQTTTADGGKWNL